MFVLPGFFKTNFVPVKPWSHPLASKWWTVTDYEKLWNNRWILHFVKQILIKSKYSAFFIRKTDLDFPHVYIYKFRIRVIVRLQLHGFRFRCVIRICVKFQLTLYYVPSMCYAGYAHHAGNAIHADVRIPHYGGMCACRHSGCCYWRGWYHIGCGGSCVSCPQLDDGWPAALGHGLCIWCGGSYFSENKKWWRHNDSNDDIMAWKYFLHHRPCVQGIGVYPAQLASNVEFE